MFTKGFIVIVLTALLALPAHADLSLDRVAVGGWSKHVPSSDTVTNETHNILAFEVDSYVAGYFKNSYGRDTYFINKVWREPATENVSFVWSIGVSHGYTVCFGPDDNSSKSICPSGWIGIEYNKYRVVPTIKWAPGAFIFSPEIKF